MYCMCVVIMFPSNRNVCESTVIESFSRTAQLYRPAPEVDTGHGRTVMHHHYDDYR